MIVSTFQPSYGVRQIGSIAFQDEPISLATARLHLRLDVFGDPPANDDDPWLQSVGIPGARAWVEGYWGRMIARRTFDVATDQFPAAGFVLPFGPVGSVLSIGYADQAGLPQTLDPDLYTLDSFSSPPVILPTYGTSWPAVRVSANSVKIRVTVGFDTEDTPEPQQNPLPSHVRSSLLLMLGHLYENREATNVTRATDVQQVPLGARELLDFDRVRLGMA